MSHLWTTTIGRRGPVLSLPFLSLIGVVTIGGAGQPQTTSPPAVSPDAASQLITESRASFSRVQDCMGTLVKQERVGGQLQPEQFIALRVRQQPFSVYLKWQSPKQFEGQEASFVAGKNNNKMRAKAAGLAGAVGFLSLEPTDPRAMKQSRHAITETGMGHLIDTIAHGNEIERRSPASQVQTRFAEYAFQQRPCTRMETVHLVNNGQFYCYRSVVYFDKGLKLPVRFEAYDWPVQGGAADGDLLECYSYIDLKYNVGLTDAAFGM